MKRILNNKDTRCPNCKSYDSVRVRTKYSTEFRYKCKNCKCIWEVPVDI